MLKDEPLEPSEPELSLEEQQEQEILAQDDAVQIQARAINDPFQSLLYISVQSEKLGKKVTTHFRYIEEVENNKVVARSMQGGEKAILGFTDEIATTEPVILRQRPIERG
jgi:hypothetical protein